MLVRLARLRSDISWHEDEIVRLLPGNGDVGERTQLACDHFGHILVAVFASLAGDLTWRYWGVDDLSCESLSYSEPVATLRGMIHWLEGGRHCEQFRVDVDLSSDPLLYSYKLASRATQKQVLYVAKFAEGWKLSG